jgi:hypothetical protein
LNTYILRNRSSNNILEISECIGALSVLAGIQGHFMMAESCGYNVVYAKPNYFSPGVEFTDVVSTVAAAL